MPSTKIVLRVSELQSVMEKGLGLIPAKKAYPVLLKTRFGIHTFGMRFPIDVVLLDGQNRVVKLWQSVSPNRIILYPIKYKKILELPEGTIRSLDISLDASIRIILEK